MYVYSLILNCGVCDMIKCELVTDGNVIMVNKFYEIHLGVSGCDVYHDNTYMESFGVLEKAIKYCLEN